MASKSDEVVLVAPGGGDYVVTNPATLHNLLARGYRTKGKTTVADAEQKLTASGPEASTGTDAKPAK
jgi:hypothetical protein